MLDSARILAGEKCYAILFSLCRALPETSESIPLIGKLQVLTFLVVKVYFTFISFMFLFLVCLPSENQRNQKYWSRTSTLAKLVIATTAHVCLLLFCNYWLSCFFFY